MIRRAFAGMRGAVGAATPAASSVITNMFGMGYDAADTNTQFMHNDAAGVATKIDLGPSFPVPTVDRTSVYEISLFSPPGTTQSLSYEVIDLVSGAVATGTVVVESTPLVDFDILAEENRVNLKAALKEETPELIAEMLENDYSKEWLKEQRQKIRDRFGPLEEGL